MTRTNSQRGKHAKQKGKRRERELANELRKLLGAKQTRRGKQYCGEGGNADVVAPDVPELYIESKGREYTNVYGALEQAETERNEDQRSIVCHKRNSKPWLVTLFLEDLVDVSEVITNYVRGKDGKVNSDD